MRALRPMTQEEREFAEQHHDLVVDFLRRKCLPMDGFYDVAIFGYLSAVQQHFRNPPVGVEFKAMAFRAMKDSLLRDGEYHARLKRRGVTVSMDALDCQITDLRQDTEQRVEDRALLERVVDTATPKEAKIISLLMDGFLLREAALLLKMPQAVAKSCMKKFCGRARAAIG